MNKNISGEDFVSSEYSSNSLSNDISLSSSNTSVKRRLKKKFESTQITTEVIKLPRELCENEDIFSAFFSMETWYSLSNTIRKHLSLFLPMFTNNIEPENLITVEALLSNKNTRFGMCPLRKLQKHIEAGNCIPDIFLRSDRVSKAKRREQRYRECKKIAALTHEIFASRDRVLREVYDDTCFLKMSSMQGSQTRKYCSNSFNFTMRAKKRYLREIMSIMGHFGSKEVFSGEDDCPVDITNMPRRQRRWFGASQDNPELDCHNIKLKDVVYRTQVSSGYRRIMPIPAVTNISTDSINCDEKTYLSNLDAKIPLDLLHENLSISNDNTNIDQSNKNTNIDSRFTSGDSKIDKVEESFDTEEDECRIVTVHNISQNNYINDYFTHSESESDDKSNSNDITNKSAFTPAFECGTKQRNEKTNKLFEITDSATIQSCQQSNVCGAIDVSNHHSNITTQITELSPYNKSLVELMQETHQCFLSLVRDMFCSTPNHRMAIEELQVKLKLWLSTPIATLNDWYHLAEDNWEDLLQSAILFLSGNFDDQPDDFVPYIEYKVQSSIYQWIGASRDSDHRLFDLCRYWLTRRKEMGNSSLVGSSKVDSSTPTFLIHRNNTYYDEDGSLEQTVSPPPPRFPTDWSVRKATEEEIKHFRDQEKRRYENPHMAFTYKQQFYSSVVGPVKGIYTQSPGISKARGHNMLIAERPNFVTILTLVRDATARLPNGEGTRADICELLKSSQYISSTATDQVLQTIVSGALDRMHTEYDPCVKYDTKRKIWIYLHRNRTEKEFELLHHQYQGIAKHKKNVHKKNKLKESCTSIATVVPSDLNRNSKKCSLQNENINSKSVSKKALQFSVSSPKLIKCQSAITENRFDEIFINKSTSDDEKIKNKQNKIETAQCKLTTSSIIHTVSSTIHTTVPIEKGGTNSTIINIMPVSLSEKSQSNASTETNNVNHSTQSFVIPSSFNVENVNNVQSKSSTMYLGVSRRNSNTATDIPVVVKTASMDLITNNTSQSKIKLQSESLTKTDKQTKIMSRNLENATDNIISSTETGVSVRPVTDILNSTRVQQTILTPAQQKQILQNLLAQQHKQFLAPKAFSAGRVVHSNNISSNLVLGTQSAVKQLHKIPTLTPSNSQLTTSSATIFKTIEKDVTSPQVIHIRPTKNINITNGANIQSVMKIENRHQDSTNRTQAVLSRKNDTLNSSLNMKTISDHTVSSPILISSASTRKNKPKIVDQLPSSLTRNSITSMNNMEHDTTHVTDKTFKTIGNNQISSFDSLFALKRVSSEMCYSENKSKIIHSADDSRNSPIEKLAVVTGGRNTLVASSLKRYIP
ncbi:uncharacterized protein LOC131437775 isoform X3 [Malaya genurostris]|uniref:uncharacterized protein LOC131437775 isoform X3 n=1 Tax=Malaya genurostris TaxID=325434 RepID=UPI0026F3A987|nr:uncharacterized protein LOC131437775 isoform X3 [Malaya genurostris]